MRKAAKAPRAATKPVTKGTPLTGAAPKKGAGVLVVLYEVPFGAELGEPVLDGVP